MKKKKVIKELEKSLKNIKEITKSRDEQGLQSSKYWEGATNYIEYALSLMNCKDKDVL